jgi:transglutaminase-like putative cysteine protease
MPRFSIRHTTTYAFSSEVSLGPHVLYLRPRADHALRLESATLAVSPAATVVWRNDAYGNSVAVATFAEMTRRLEITSELIVEKFPRSEGQRQYLLALPQASYTDAERRALQPFLGVEPADRRSIDGWMKKTATKSKPTYAKVLECAARIHSEFDYRPRFEPGVQSARETLAEFSGTCRDFAELMIAAARGMGCAARFVTGYVFVPNAAGAPCSPHAWAECYLPGAGWIEIDATNGLVEPGDLIPVAVAATGAELTPVAGTFTGIGGADLFVGVDVIKLS